MTRDSRKPSSHAGKVFRARLPGGPSKIRSTSGISGSHTLNVDGIHGPKTMAAVKAFQQAISHEVHGFLVDGIACPAAPGCGRVAASRNS
jgi:peptidoglycan hydrolase-like protein with peptidoglycan-binding domain